MRDTKGLLGLVAVMVTLAVVSMMKGQVLAFADESAEAGGTPQADGDSTESAEETGSEDEESGESTDESASEVAGNGDEQHETGGDPPADVPGETEAFEE